MNARGRRQLGRVAHHEAGHVMAAVLLGRRHGWVSIVPEDLPAGRTLGNVQRWEPSEALFRPETPYHVARYQLEQEALVLLAGEAADARYCGSRWRAGHRRAGACGDHALVMKYALHLSGGDAEEAAAHVAWLGQRARALIDDDANWAGVQALAAALLEKGRLSRRDARRIVIVARTACVVAQLYGAATG
jgi:hypothetical protein